MKTFLKALVGSLLVLLVAAGLFLYWPLYERSAPAADNADQPVDAVLIGGGIMSVTLATYLQELEPGWQIHMFERLGDVALESSNGWNNAGTGHSGFAELNYTPELADGSIETSRAVAIAEQFEVSRQFWAHQVELGRMLTPATFINPTPHMSFVWGDENIDYLRKRHQALITHPLFHGMEYSEDPALIRKWAPLMMEGRNPQQRVAATYMPLGTDVNFGAITHQLTQSLLRSPSFHMHLQHEVAALNQNEDKSWNVTVRDVKTGETRTVRSRFVFIGAGGAALKLLQLSGIPESKNYAGFPVGGQFLAIKASAVSDRHNVKAYGMAETGSPPMSVPHLDARRLDDKNVVLFGPFALFSTKFLKEGSWFDLFSSVNHNNVTDMLRVGSENMDLVSYLMEQIVLTDDDRHAQLRKYFPQAKREDWELITAGQRVQIIKHDPEKGAVLQFGTEIVTDQHGTIAALLGASPGASTSPHIMLSLLDKAFPQKMNSGWKEQLTQIIPSYSRKINDSKALTNQIRGRTSKVLQLPHIEIPEGEPVLHMQAATPELSSPALKLAPAS